MSDGTDAQQADQVRWGLHDAILWLTLAIAITLLLSQPSAVLLFQSPTAVAIIGTVLPWLVLIAAVLVSTYVRGRRSLPRDFGLRFRSLDLLWGLILGLLLRAISTLIDIGVWGRLPRNGPSLEGAVMPLTLIVLFSLGGVLISPFVEELFFRGLVLRAFLHAISNSTGPAVARSVAVVISAVAFSAVHVLTVTSPAMFFVTAITTLIVGVALGSLAAATDRLGGAVFAHVVFNASGVALSYLA